MKIDTVIHITYKKGLYKMSKLEDKRKESVKKYQDIFKEMKQEEANNYITAEVTITKISKGLMAAYIQKYATKAEDQKWVNEEFRKAAYKKVPKTTTTVIMDDKGNAVYKVTKSGKTIAAKKKVALAGSEMVKQFNIAGARKEFISHFSITPKESVFKPKAKRSEDIYDEFAGLFS
jgi:hypothetical protein